MNETAEAKGHTYFTLVCGSEERALKPIAKGHKQESLDGYYTGLPQ